MSDESTEYYTLICDDPSHEVVLIDCGPRDMDVTRAVRKVTGLSLWHSRPGPPSARHPPRGLSAHRAQSAVALLQSAGAKRSGDRNRSGERARPLRGDSRRQRKAPYRGDPAPRGLTRERLLLLALGVAGDLGELGFCWSGVVGSYAWWSSSVAIGHC